MHCLVHRVGLTRDCISLAAAISLSVVIHVFLLIFLLIYSDFVLYIICTRCFSLLCAQSLKAIACHNLWPTLSWAEWQSGGGQRAWQQSLCHSNKSVLQKIHFMISCQRWGWRLVECLVTSITVLVTGYMWRCAGPCLVPTRNPGDTYSSSTDQTTPNSNILVKKMAQHYNLCDKGIHKEPCKTSWQQD